jgi:acetyltransferase-like isoleucine patch superfamily enzyme
MKEYFDRSLFANPVTNYFRWLSGKIYYQLKHWGKHLRISYGTLVRNSKFGRYNWLGNYNMILNSELGDHSYIAGHSLVRNCRIGKYCSIAQYVQISPGHHPTSGFVSIHPSTFSQPDFHAKRYLYENHFEPNEQVEIGNDVWIGANVVITGGVKIGNGVIVAANSVVNKNVDDFDIVGGTPAKFIRKRFTDEQIIKLKEIRWWDKGDDWVQANISKFRSIDEFVSTLS